MNGGHLVGIGLFLVGVIFWSGYLYAEIRNLKIELHKNREHVHALRNTIMTQLLDTLMEVLEHGKKGT